MRNRISPTALRGKAAVAWPHTFWPGQAVRLRGRAAKSGIVVRPGLCEDEWVISFRDGERDVYLLEHLERFVPGVWETRSMDYLRYVEFSRN